MHERMTREDVAKMQAELDHRKLVVRHQILDELKEAKAQGDLSENFEYHAAKQARGKNESRIRYLQGMINTAIIVDDTKAEQEEGVVSMDKPVRIYIPEDDEEQEIRIVTSIRGNSMKGLISIESPLGKAILYHKVGDTVSVKISDDYSYDVVIKDVGEAIDESKDQIKGF
jgi:transcription elongation factor GreA